MDRYPWSADVTPTAGEVERILGRRFPELRPVRARYLDRGFGYTAFTVNGDLVFRFPKRADVEPAVDLERRILAAIADRLPVRVPAYRHVGEPGPDFPFRFSPARLACALRSLDLHL